ncbi:hypothetical protein A8V01_24885 [Novosphingobium guangzhouense]|uniref:Uncharacterized protein n=1 Tax=Novosphingobium guangzhouense TaxID=1850347 RepID=A0A2K2FWG9_9SPHN|nr:hypothetical protein A8V01_24885 [Novosphingobium guangzhouense]
MNRFAIDVLDEARQRAYEKPIPAEPAMRLALAWLAVNRLGEPYLIEQFWASATKPARPDDSNGYCRKRDLQVCINRWTFLAKQRRL